jgi:dTDP-4-dehydrorhamnose 3,5-epimerase
MPFDFKPFKDLPEVIIIEPKVFPDGRGWFAETYKKSDFARSGISSEFTQDNHSRSAMKGILRGLHYQKEPEAQGKLIRCVVGEVFDVAVDLRKGSPSYAKWVSATLSAENRQMIWVPEGFAHGVLTTSDTSEVLYKVTCEYSPTCDRVIRWNDPQIAVKWPVCEPILSKKDADAPLLVDAENNFVWRKQI